MIDIKKFDCQKASVYAVDLLNENNANKITNNLKEEIIDLKKARDAYKDQVRQLIEIINGNRHFKKKIIVKEQGWLPYENIEIVSK